MNQVFVVTNEQLPEVYFKYQLRKIESQKWYIRQMYMMVICHLALDEFFQVLVMQQHINCISSGGKK